MTEIGVAPGYEPDVAKAAADLKEIGASGLRQSNGVIQEEYLRELQGAQGAKVYRQMEANSPIVGAMIFTISMFVRGAEWRTDPLDASLAEDVEAAAHVESCRNDMSASWDDTIAEILTLIPYGWSLHEIVYKLRQGPDHKDPSKRSEYDDGRVGWRKLPRRDQSSLRRWVFDEAGGLQAMIQAPPPEFRERTIPIEKALLFRANGAGANPEGRSFLRNAYRPWYNMTRMEEIEGVGAERDLAGMFTMWIPGEWLAATATPEQKAAAAEFQRIASSVRRNENEGLVLPLSYDAEKNPRFKAELMSSTGRRQFDTDKIISRYAQQISMTLLADFLLLGHESVGSKSLGVTKAELFTRAVEAIADSIADVFNRHAIPRLLQLNGMKGRARLVRGGLGKVDFEALSLYLTALADSGKLDADDPIGRHLRELAKIPHPETAATAEKRRREGFRKAAGAPAVPVAKEDEPTDPIDAVARSMAPAVREQFLTAVQRLRDGADLEALTAALEDGDEEGAAAALKLDASAEELQPMVEQLRAGLELAGDAAAEALGARLQAEVRFDSTHPRVVAWLDEHGAELVRGISDQARSAVRARISEVIASGESPRAAAAVIREHVGLSERDSRAATAFEARLREEGVDEASIQQQAARYRDAKLRDRANTIADHEALEAAGAGRHESWTQATEDGYLPADVRRRLLVSDDERECRICDGVRTKTFGLEEDIIPGRRRAPLHVKCRCPEVLVFGVERGGAASGEDADSGT